MGSHKVAGLVLAVQSINELGQLLSIHLLHNNTKCFPDSGGFVDQCGLLIKGPGENT